MSTPLSINPSFEQAKEWILRNIEDCIVAEPANLSKVPKKKGFYFWFMKPEGYKELSKFVEIDGIEPRVEKDGRHLVYIGTAGSGKEGNSHLFERLKWHITQAHSKSAICSGVISNFRAGLGALLSEDLILPNTEPELNAFLKNYFVVCWVTLEDESTIDLYEGRLIKIIRPVFNIKLNPNATVANHATRLYNTRRALILKSTQERLGCLKKQNDNLDDVKVFQGKPIGPRVLLDGAYFDLTIEDKIPKIYDANGDEYTKNKKEFFRKINRDYTLNVLLNNENRNEKNTNQLGSDVINSLSKNKTSTASHSKAQSLQSKPKLAKKSTKEFKELESVVGKTLIILNCVAKKKSGGNTNSSMDYFDNSDHAFKAIRDSMIDSVSNPHLNIIKDQKELLPAYKRYKGFYTRINWANITSKFENKCLCVVIVSALFGLVEYKRTIPNYDLEISQTKGWGNTINEAIDKYIKDNDIDIVNVHSFLSEPYGNYVDVPHYKCKSGSNQYYIADWVNAIVNVLKCQ